MAGWNFGATKGQEMAGKPIRHMLALRLQYKIFVSKDAFPQHVVVSRLKMDQK